MEASATPSRDARVDVAELVARYAPIGKRHRRRRLVVRGAIAVAVPMAALVAWLVGPTLSAPQSANYGNELREVKSIRAQVRVETAALRAERHQWDVQRRAYDKRNSMLEAKLAELDAARQALRRQQQQFEQQRLALAGTTGQPEPTDARQAAQRREVSFQSELVARELKALSSQRADLEQQHADLETQRHELQTLMERYDAATKVKVQPEMPADSSPAAVPEADAKVSPAVAASGRLLMAASEPVPAEMLGTMRGGMQIPGGLDITFGLTHSASLNGVEQFSSSIYVDDLSRLSEAMAGDFGAQSVLIQSGDGNLVNLDALSGQMGTLIQNTLDSQVIATKTIIDVSVGNFGNFAATVGATQAIAESLSFQQP